MPKSLSLFLITAPLALCALGALAASIVTPPHSATPVNASSSASHLHVGQTLYVRLTTSPATGYAWTFIGPLPPMLRMDRDPGLMPFDRTRPGAPAIQTWTFRAQRRGRVLLEFVYRRPWEPDAMAADRRQIEVVVD